MAKQSFFGKKQGAAVLKHGTLGRYLYTWASMVGSRSPGHKVYYLDGYAGPGTYDDGTPGSPQLAVSTAMKTAPIRDFRGICVESKRKQFKELEQLLAPYPNWKAVGKKIEDCLPQLVTEIGPAPLFAFFDPFGVGLPFNMVVEVMKRSAGRSRIKTELLLNFSLRGLSRNARAANSRLPATPSPGLRS